MPATITVQRLINFVRPILKQQPLDVTNMEPALFAANIILQRILAPPFVWPWNRGIFSFSTVATKPPVTDYQQAIPDWGFLETQWVADADGRIFELNGDVSLPVTSDVGRPTMIAVQFDDNAGNITFRLKNGPDGVYRINTNYQRKAKLLSSFACTFGPVSDQFSFVFSVGFLAIMALLTNDSRFPIFEQWFISALLGVQDGLTDQQRSIFIGNWTAMVGTLNRTSGAVQAGIAARSK